MKKYLLIVALVVGAFSVEPVSAQVNVQINVNSQPDWGPSGYNRVSYYYLPEINMYYDVQSRYFLYNNGRNWVRYRALPARYRGFDLYGAYKVVVNDRYPWRYNANHRRAYVRYVNLHNQQRSWRDVRGGNHDHEGVSGHNGHGRR